MAFKLSLYPWVHMAKYSEEGGWQEQYIEKQHLNPRKEEALPQDEKEALLAHRNSFPELPLVNYTSQYGLGCFEGLKAFPQKTGGVKVFRPDRNTARMIKSMKGMYMPPIEAGILLEGILGTVRRNADLGFKIDYDPAWETDFWMNAAAVYIRPFAFSEEGIGVNISRSPWVVTINTPVTSYFTNSKNEAVTTHRIRANPGGTGGIKCTANYVTSILAKQEAMDQGFLEALFLDAKTGEYIEEGSSCNFFCLLESGVLVTPRLGDTILPGITRASIIELARDRGLSVEERDLSITEVMETGQECFVTGTAVGITPLSGLAHKKRRSSFTSMEEGSLALSLLKELKGIQYGALEDRFGWMVNA